LKGRRRFNYGKFDTMMNMNQACLDLIDKRAGKKKFGGRHMLEYAENIGLGTRKYELVKVD